MTTNTLTPLQLLCQKGIFENTPLIDWADDQATRAVTFLAESRIAKLKTKRISTSDPDQALLKAEIRALAQKYIYDKINAEFKRNSK